METAKRKRGPYGHDGETKKDCVIKFRCRKAVYDVLQDFAKGMNRSMSYIVNDIVEYVLEDDIAAYMKNRPGNPHSSNKQ